MYLEKIKNKDVLHFDNPEYGGIGTCFCLSDYDWMSYKLTTRFRTEKTGVINVKFEYFGLIESTMTVIQILNGVPEEIIYVYSTDIFKKYHIKFLERHIRSWNDEYAFDGQDIVVDFFNEVLDVGTIKSILPVNKE